MTNGRFLVPVAIVLTLPGLAAGVKLFSAGPVSLVLVSTLTIVAAWILMLSIAQDVQGATRTLVLVLIAVAVLLPEYSVDAYFARGSAYPYAVESNPLALAATIGSQRLLMGVGWPVLVFLFWLKNRRTRPVPGQGFSVQLALLFLATLYAFIIYMKGEISVFDTFALFSLFGLFVWRGSWREHGERTEPHSAGVLTVSRDAYCGANRKTGALLVIYAALSMYTVLGPFAGSFLEVGQRIGIEQSVLAQWILPALTKAPWLILAAMLVWKASAKLAFTSLLTTHMGLGTLLVGALPIVALVSGSMPGSIDALALDDRQRIELLLTATQSLFVVAMLSGLTLSWKSALGMLGLFVAQSLLSALQSDKDATLVQGLFSMIYLSAAIGAIVGDRSRLRVLTGALPVGLGGLHTRRDTQTDGAEL